MKIDANWGKLMRCQDGMGLILVRCQDGMVLIPRAISRWYGFDTCEALCLYGFDTR